MNVPIDNVVSVCPNASLILKPETSQNLSDTSGGNGSPAGTGYYNKNSEGRVDLTFAGYDYSAHAVTLTDVQTLSVFCPRDADGGRINIDTSSFKGWTSSGNLYSCMDYDTLLDVTQYLQDGCYICLFSRD